MSPGDQMELFEYTDYRGYLTDYYQNKKRAQPQWGYASWARGLGLKSKSTLAMILNGQRHPSRKLTSTFSDYFKFSTDESEYFVDLVELQKSQGATGTKLLLIERLAKKRKSGEFEHLDLNRFQLISKWYFAAIREMPNAKGFRWDPQWISHQLYGAISPQEIKEAMRILSQLGLLVKQPSGAMTLKTANLTTESDVADEGIKRFHEQMLDQAKDSIRETDPTEREFVSTTFVVRQSDLPEAKMRLRELSSQFADSIEKQPGDRVYQLEVAFFPLSRARSRV